MRGRSAAKETRRGRKGGRATERRLRSRKPRRVGGGWVGGRVWREVRVKMLVQVRVGMRGEGLNGGWVGGVEGAQVSTFVLGAGEGGWQRGVRRGAGVRGCRGKGLRETMALTGVCGAAEWRGGERGGGEAHRSASGLCSVHRRFASSNCFARFTP